MDDEIILNGCIDGYYLPTLNILQTLSEMLSEQPKHYILARTKLKLNMDINVAKNVYVNIYTAINCNYIDCSLIKESERNHITC